MLRYYFILFFIFFAGLAYCQEIPYHTSNQDLYDFIDELANAKIINVNSVIKPYNRKFIAEKLQEALLKKSELSKRQQKEILFYLKDFYKDLNQSNANDFVAKSWFYKNYKSPVFTLKDGAIIKKRLDLFYYSDSNFSVTINPIVGEKYYSNENGAIHHRWNGAEFFAYAGKHWAMYANLRDNRITNDLVSKTYLTDMPGIDNKGGKDFSEMRGGISYSWNWGSLALQKDHFVWGNSYHGSNIFSGREPSVTQLKLHLNPTKWLDFNYIHAWLNSEVLDSLRTYKIGTTNRDVFYEKYIAANMYTVRMFKYLNVSLGNSIVYSSENVNPTFLIPFLYYKSTDHTNSNSNNGGSNAQIFFDISSRNLKYVHIYTSVFIDEINFSKFYDTARSTNWYSLKVGMRISNFPIKNLILTGEYTRTNPMVYKHYIETTNFESNQYNLGHYLRDNAQEIYLALGYKPVCGLHFNLAYIYAEKGPDYVDDRSPGHVQNIEGLPFIDMVMWKRESIEFKTSYQVINDGYLFFEYVYSNIKGDKTVIDSYTPKYLLGETNTFSLGVNFGF
jgi:hypothetical protein